MIDLRQRHEQILGFPWELWKYLQWSTSERQRERRIAVSASVYEKDVVFFELRHADVPVPVPSVMCRAVGDGVEVRSPRGVRLLRGADLGLVERLLAKIDGTRAVRPIIDIAPNPKDALSLLESALGIALEVPEAVRALESGISGVEIVRLPASPYAIDRAYWTNMSDVRAELRELDDVVARDALQPFLRHLHVVATMGRNLDSFYKPASPIADSGVCPGRVRVSPVIAGPDETQFSHVQLYVALNSIALSSAPESIDGVSWGEVTTRDLPLLNPPRPEAGHFAAMTRTLAAARAARGDALVQRVAEFHWQFVRVHPFECANQSIAMNIVNFILGRGVGKLIPHLDLDYFALLFGKDDYVTAFTRAFRAYATDANAPSDWAKHQKRSRDGIDLVLRLRTMSPAEAFGLVSTDETVRSLLFIA